MNVNHIDIAAPERRPSQAQTIQCAIKAKQSCPAGIPELHQIFLVLKNPIVLKPALSTHFLAEQKHRRSSGQDSYSISKSASRFSIPPCLAYQRRSVDSEHD